MRLFADRVMPVLQRDRAFAGPADGAGTRPASTARPASSRRREGGQFGGGGGGVPGGGGGMRGQRKT